MALAAELLFWLSNKPKPLNQRANTDRERGKSWDEVTMTRQAEKSNFNVALSKKRVDSSMCDRIKKTKTNTKLSIKMTIAPQKCPSGDRKQRGCMTRVLKTCHPRGQDDKLGGHRSAHNRTKITQQSCWCVSKEMWRLTRGHLNNNKKKSNLFRRQSFSIKLAQHRSSENKKISWIYNYEYSCFISTAQTVSHKYHSISHSPQEQMASCMQLA